MKKGKEFAFRVLSTVIFVPLLAYSLFHEKSYLFPTIITVAAMWGLSEFYSLAKKSGIQSTPPLGYIAGILGLIGSTFFPDKSVFLWIMIFWNLIGIGFIYKILKGESISQPTLSSLASTLMGVLYVVYPFSLLVTMQHIPDGAWLLIWMVLITWACDTAAYLTGSMIGKHKLCPSISPGKTIEGVVGGVTLSLIAALGLPRLFPASCRLTAWSFGTLLGIGLLLTVIGILGDLAESVLKRQAGVKDSGNTYTGHGGMLDIVDSLLFTAPVFYFLLNFIL
jgi:phosphatidate cytidylyltransferase